MPKVSGKKTKSAPKVSDHRNLLTQVGVIVVLLTSFWAPLWLMSKPQPNVRIAGNSFRLEVAETDAKRAQGLSTHLPLAADGGMLFVFPQLDRACMWMKNMFFPIDILWFDGNKQLVQTKENVSPSTYPEAFCAPISIKYVVELPAGTVSRLGIPGKTILEFVKR